MIATATDAEQYAEAIVRYTTLTDQQPDNAEYWFDLVHFSAQLQRNDEALAALERGLTLDPTNRVGLANCVIVLDRLGRYGDIVVMAERALSAYEVYLTILSHMSRNHLLAYLQDHL